MNKRRNCIPDQSACGSPRAVSVWGTSRPAAAAVDPAGFVQQEAQARAGHASALSDLGLCYLSGWHVPVDPETALAEAPSVNSRSRVQVLLPGVISNSSTKSLPLALT